MIDGALFFVLADGHHNSLGLVRSLGMAGYKPIVFFIGIDKGLVCYSKYVAELSLFVSADEAIDEILRYKDRPAPAKFIVTGNDKFVSAIDRRYSELCGSFITYNCGASNALNRLMEKAVQNELAIKARLNVPAYAVVNPREKVVPSVPFPVITKAVNSIGEHWKDIVFFCHDEQELLEAFNKIDCEKVLVQHYVDKYNETGFNGISIKGGEEVYLPLQLTYKTTEKTTFGNSIRLFKPTDCDLTEKIKKLIKYTGYSGSFSVDLLIGKDSKVYFLEINFRNSGWSFPYTCAGVNLPAIWAESSVDGHLNTSRTAIRKLPFTAVDEFLEMYGASKKGLFKMLTTLFAIVGTNAHIFWNRKDQLPFWHLLKATFKSHSHFK